jgi:allantoin racemase
MRENVIKYGFQDHLASFRAIGMGVLDLQVDPEETKRRIAQAAERAIESDGAEVIILGCTHQFGFYRELQAALGIPVIDVACAALNYAEFLIDLRDKHGWYFNKKNEYLSTSKRRNRSLETFRVISNTFDAKFFAPRITSAPEKKRPLG